MDTGLKQKAINKYLMIISLPVMELPPFKVFIVSTPKKSDIKVFFDFKTVLHKK